MARMVLLATLALSFLTTPGLAQNFNTDLVWVGAGDMLKAYRLDGTLVVATPGLPGGTWGIGIDSQRSIWVSNFSAGQNTVSKFASNGALVGTFPAGPAVTANQSSVGPLAIDRDDNVYVGDPRSPGGTTITKLDSQGNTILSFGVAGQSVRSIAVDAAGDIWAVSYGAGGVLQKFSPAGAMLLTISQPGAWSPNSVYADEWGRVTVTHFPLNTNFRRYQLDGTLVGTYVAGPGGGDQSMNTAAVAPDGKTWVVEAYIPRLDIFNAAGVSSLTLPTSYPVTGISFDGEGATWTSSEGLFLGAPILLSRLLPSGAASIPPITIGTVHANGFSLNVGDMTGMVRARTVDPYADLDGDGFPNYAEVVAGSSPLDPQSTPATMNPLNMPTIGTTFQIQIAAPRDAQAAYFMPFSTNGTPFPLTLLTPTDARIFAISPLDPITSTTIDPLWDLSASGLFPGNLVFPDTFGFLDSAGTAFVRINIPNVPSLIGLTFYGAFATLDTGSPSGLKTLSQAITVTLE